MQSPAIPTGIDLGTVFSCVGVWQQSKVEIISNNEGNQLTPSYIAFTWAGRLIGDAAKNQMDVNLQNTVVGIRSLMGRSFDHPKIREIVKNHSFHVVSDCDRLKIQVDWKGETKYFAPEEISAMVLSTLKKVAENYQRSCVKDTVMTVPAYFNSNQRKAVKDAGTIAGLNVLRIISKPIAAALAHHFFVGNVKGQKNILTLDLGSETTEVSIVGITAGSLEIKGIVFDQGFGGTDFDNRLVKHLTNEFKRKFKLDLKSDSVYKLQSAAQQAKHSLSSSTEVEIEIDALLDGINFSTKVSRSKFDEICSDLFRKTLDLVKKVLRDAKLDPSSIDDIVLVGGSTRIPKIKNLLQSFFFNKTLNFSTDPQVIVANGAAIVAAILSRDLSVGPQIHIGPLSLVDVTPFSLSIGTAGGEISKIIKRNTRIPCRQTRSITTDTDCQSIITVNVYEGERAVNINNDLLCTFQIREISSAPSGVPKIDVTFGLDENGLLEITAVENYCHISKPLQVVVHNNRELSKEEVTKMAAEEAERCKEEDFGIGLQQNIQKGIKRRISE